MKTRNGSLGVMSVVCFAALLVSVTPSRLRAAEPETVMVTLHAKPGAEDELARVLARHWETLRRLNLVRETPHVTLRGVEVDNKTYFVEIFTWRDESIPDHAPAEVLALWTELNRLVEQRSGQAGLHFVPVLDMNASRSSAP